MDDERLTEEWQAAQGATYRRNGKILVSLENKLARSGLL